MATPQLSPGVLIREVDLTVGRSENVLDNIGAIAGPFSLGPVNEAITIETEQELINTFGKPLSTDRQYEYWMSASSFLSYGGIVKVIRTGGGDLTNANAGVGIASTAVLRIDNYDDFEENHLNDNTFIYAAKNPGSWGSEMKVCTIDNAADQRLGINTVNPGAAGAIVGHGVTSALSSIVIPGAGSTSVFNGYLNGIITGVSTDALNGNSTIDVKIVSRVSSGGTETKLNYQQSNPSQSIELNDNITFVDNAGISTGNGSVSTVVSEDDWYDQQTLGLSNSIIYWKSLAPKPIDTNYSASRSGRNDAIHIVVVDDRGTISGIQGNLLEKFLNLSKASDATADADSPTRTYYKDFVALNSKYIYSGYNTSQAVDSYHGTSPKAVGFSDGYVPNSIGEGLWGQEAQGVEFSALGNVTYTLGGGVDYQAGGGMSASLGDINTSYRLFANRDEIAVDYLIMGPGLAVEAESQAKANLLISIVESRKDCMATLSPHRANVVNVNNPDIQTDNILRFYSSLSSSSYVVFDSGWKYTYDRFNNEFRYLPCNADVAGLMVRTSIEAYPWFSPAGLQRGVLNNAIKLAYNPNKSQRDVLYGSRVNSIVNQRGSGVLLFGDKTGLGYASAFDRINVRRLFLTVEQALEGAANSQLFELNDSITRSNFVNIVEPYLRDVEAKRGLYGFLVVCDESNNTPDIIDNNEFRADIYLKPTKSINYVTLTFVATRTGVSFEEVVGTV